MKMNGRNLTVTQCLIGHPSERISERSKISINAHANWFLALTPDERQYYREHPAERPGCEHIERTEHARLAARRDDARAASEHYALRFGRRAAR